jgi:biotin carboxyl carrier protein
MKLQRVGDRQEAEIELSARDGATIRARIGDDEISAEFERLPDGSAMLTLGGAHYRISGARRGDSILVTVGPRGFEFKPVVVRRAGARGGLAASELTSPMPGKVLKVLVNAGDTIKAGEAAVVIEAMKMETLISAEAPAKVSKVRVEVGQMVDANEVLVELSPLADSSAPQSEPSTR